MKKPKKSPEQRILDAETFASKALADGNEHAENGRHDKAEKCFKTSQYWLDRWVSLTGSGDKEPPKR